MNIENRLRELGLVLPSAPKPIAAYVPAVRTANLVFIAGQLPLRDGKLVATGRVPSAVKVEEAKQAARQCVLNALATLKDTLGGDLSKLTRVVRVGVFVQSDDNFHDQSQVANGASELLGELLGDAGRHARVSVGVNTLPLDASVEVEFVFEVA